jgi:SecD/SecF fusion protein
MLLILGVSSIREFALPLLIGVICGTYSSVFIATPLWWIARVYLKTKNKINEKHQGPKSAQKKARAARATKENQGIVV